MGGKVNNSIGKKERTRNEKEKKKINSITIIYLIYFVVLYLLYRNDEIILLNVKWWYYLIIYLFISFLIYLILNIPIIKRKIASFDHWTVNILVSFVLSFFISILCNFGLKYLVNDFATESAIRENCEILEIKKGRYRRGGDYYNLKVNFRGKEETIVLDKSLYQQLETISVIKSHAIIKFKPSIFDICVVENVLIESKNIPK